VLDEKAATIRQCQRENEFLQTELAEATARIVALEKLLVATQEQLAAANLLLVRKPAPEDEIANRLREMVKRHKVSIFWRSVVYS
jgi:hypothetical protein